MEIYIFYTIFFIIGTLLGSFFTLAIHRIPKKQNITHERSYCPNCKHKLGFFDLIPIFSYLSLKGKCKYCQERISPKYLIIELLSGITFLLFAISLNINIYNLTIIKLISLGLGMVYISTLCLIAGIDRQTRNISKKSILFGLIIQTMYIIYLYISKIDIYKYVIYLTIMLIFMIAETIYLKKRGKTSYGIQLLILCIYMIIFTNEDLTSFSMAITVLITMVNLLINKNNNTKKKEIPVASYLCFSNIALIIIENFLKI